VQGGEGEGSPGRAEAPPALVAQARTERAAFGQLYDLYVRRVYAFCALGGCSREEAEDLTAQTFERALRAIGRYEERGAPLSAWLLCIAAHVVADRARRAEPLDDAAPLVDDEGAAADAVPDWAEEWERATWLRGHLVALPADQQRVVQLRYYEDRSFSDVAARMGRSENAVKQLLRRALAAVRMRVHEEAVDDG
jgi:RNA polymerase sigma-70 factor (ECF subfamily)